MRHWQAGVILGLCMAGSSALAQQASEDPMGSRWSR